MRRSAQRQAKRTVSATAPGTWVQTWAGPTSDASSTWSELGSYAVRLRWLHLDQEMARCCRWLPVLLALTVFWARGSGRGISLVYQLCLRLLLLSVQYSLDTCVISEGRLGRAVFTRKYANLDHSGDVEAMLRKFLAEAVARGNATHGVDGAAISIAGPVRRNICEMTNLAQTVDGLALAKTFDIPGGVTLINDFVAAGYGVLTLQPSEYITLQEGEADERAPISLLGAGTGLGECFVTRDLE